MFQEILQSHHEILKIKYFTARVSARPKDPTKPERQNVYLRALRAYCPVIKFYDGRFQTHTKRLPLADNPEEKVPVLRTEEKGTDVNITVHLLNDAWLDLYDCAILVSNDSDLSTAMRLVKEERGKSLGLLTPGASQPTSFLNRYATFHRNIEDSYLENNQLPPVIPNTDITKPTIW